MISDVFLEWAKGRLINGSEHLILQVGGSRMFECATEVSYSYPKAVYRWLKGDTYLDDSRNTFITDDG